MTKRQKRQKQALCLLISVLLGLTVAFQIRSSNTALSDSQDLVELQNNVKSYAEKNNELNQRNRSLYEEIERLRSSQLEGDSAYKEILAERNRYATFAGLTKVENSGLTVTMGMTGQALITDAMIRIVVNELNAVGAQAISINEQRKVATTEIRSTGDKIIINGVSFPRNEDFVLKAIIGEDQLDYAVSLLESLKKSLIDTLETGDNLTMTIRREENVEIPALSEDSISYKMDLLKSVDGE